MSYERRERYAAAIFGCDDEYPWGDLRSEDQCAYYPYAEAAMAVADAENARLRAEISELDKACNGLDAENARLRDEIGTEVNGICTGMHADLAEAQSAWEEERAENVRLRAQLAEAAEQYMARLRGLSELIPNSEWTEHVARVEPGSGWVRAGAIEVRTELSDPAGVIHVRMARP